MATPRPAWQTDELDEEWVDGDDVEDSEDDDRGTADITSSSISLTIPLSSIAYSHNQDQNNTSSNKGGTFHINEDVAPAALLAAKTPGKKAAAGIKDFFSPLPLERMFEPPSPIGRATHLVPPAATRPGSSLKYEAGSSRKTPSFAKEPEQPLLTGDDPQKARFTFSVPRSVPRGVNGAPKGSAFDPPQAQSTPGPSSNPAGKTAATDPRGLRLFQFQYDTFTRDHLSAIVDSIAVNTPSTGSKFDSSSPGTPLDNPRLSRVTESADAESDLRSAKRLKLSPKSDFYGEGDGAGAVIGRPLFGRDYVGESRNLMAQIKQAKDYSTVSTVASNSTPAMSRILDQSQHQVQGNNSNPLAPLAVLSTHTEAARPSSSATGTTPTTTSSSTILQQAANLMAQIKHDVHGQRRIFSGDTDFTHTTSFLDDKSRASSPPPHRNGSVIIHNTGSELRRPSWSRSSSFASSSNTPMRTRPSVEPIRPTNPLLAQSTIMDLADDISNLDLSSNQSSSRSSGLERSTSSSVGSGVHRSSGTRKASSGHTNPPASSTAVSRAVSQAQPVHPPNPARGGQNEDLNRFVSSSTAVSGLTGTAVSSVDTFVKHPGAPLPVHAHAQIRRIGPEDLPPLPARVGNMVYDPVMMIWVKSHQNLNGSGNHTATADTDASEDPFRDIESLEEEQQEAGGTPEVQDQPAEVVSGLIDPRMARIEEQSEVEEDSEEAHLNSFSFDEPASINAIPPIMTGADNQFLPVENGLDSDEDEQDEQLFVSGTGFAPTGLDTESEGEVEDQDPTRTVTLDGRQQDVTPPMISSSDAFSATSVPAIPATSATPAIRSVLKCASVVKGADAEVQIEEYYVTPAQKKRHRRSVSFSDGKLDGQIRGIGRNADDSSASITDNSLVSFTEGNSVLMPSARSKRIADMMEAFEESDSDDRQRLSALANGTPSPIGIQSPARRASSSTSKASGLSPHRKFSRSRTHRSSPRRSTSRSFAQANGTFLTECSFAVTHDRLVQIITDVQPFEPYWEDLSSIDLSHKSVDSVARLKEFLPKLDSLTLNSNQLCWLSGIPGSVRTLSVSSNSLTSMTSYSHLHNLENLDISNNEVDSLLQLSCLRHLRELRADSNKIASLEGLEKMTGLIKLSVQDNRIRNLDFQSFRLARLEMLNMSKNRIHTLLGIVCLPSLIALNIDDNYLTELQVTSSLPRMRILRASGNKLRTLGVSRLPNLRTLYADNNALTSIQDVDRLTKLENLSARNQSGQGLTLATRDVRDVKRLYISGNPMKSGLLREPCYNLVYLELAACRLTRLPSHLSTSVPNLRVLNLNYNFLETVESLEGLSRIKKLSVIGSRLKGTRTLVRVLGGMKDVEMLDFRMNPCTLGWYLPLLVKDIPGALQPSDTSPSNPDTSASSSSSPGTSSPGQNPSQSSARSRESKAWQEMDAKFRRDLPDDSYIGRLAYRGLVMRACPGIRMLDGVEVTEKERSKADRLLVGLQEKKTKSQVQAAAPGKEIGEGKGRKEGSSKGKRAGNGNGGR